MYFFKGALTLLTNIIGSWMTKFKHKHLPFIPFIRRETKMFGCAEVNKGYTIKIKQSQVWVGLARWRFRPKSKSIVGSFLIHASSIANGSLSSKNIFSKWSYKSDFSLQIRYPKNNVFSLSRFLFRWRDNRRDFLSPKQRHILLVRQLTVNMS